MTPTPVTAWWQQPELLGRWSRDLLHAEMAQLRPGGWPWPMVEARADMHLVQDAGADSLELLALSSAWAERLDLRQEAELQLLMRQPSWQGWQAAALARLQRGDPVMRFATSGSTGRARPVAHDMAELQQEVNCIAERLCVGSPHRPPIRRIVTVVRSHHIYGFLFTVLLPGALSQHSQGGLVPVVDAVQESPPLVRQRLQEGDLLVAFPDWWALAVRDGQPWPKGVTGVSSTAPCPTSVAQAAGAADVARWIEVYGSTETAGVGWREDPTEPFELQRYWQRVEPTMTEPEPMLQRLRPEGGTGPTMATPDHLDWYGPRHFRPRGRRDGVVQVGGINVDPAEVARRLRAHPLVADAVVRLHGQTDGSREGTDRLKAFVVPREGHDPSVVQAELAAWCRTQFVPAARPVHIRIGEQVPRNEMGKLSDWDVSG